MKLDKKVKTALDETRILILGSEVLIGFQFRGVFRDGYEQLPGHARYADAVALGLMMVVLGLLIAPSMRHQVAEDGHDSGALQGFVGLMAGLALFPFALSLGLDLFIVVERILGLGGGVMVATAFTLLAVFFWYGLEYLRRRETGRKERAVTAEQMDEIEPTPLHTRISQMLTESRVVLPGAQALLGFQLAIVITQSFDALPEASKLVHGASLGCIALAVILLMAPAAYHRIVYAGEDSEDVLRMGGRFVVGATVPLAFGLAGDMYVVIAKIAGSTTTGVASAAATLALLVGLWHVYPAVLRRTRLPQVREAEERQRKATS